jgi:hypothetical protein
MKNIYILIICLFFTMPYTFAQSFEWAKGIVSKRVLFNQGGVGIDSLNNNYVLSRAGMHG